MVCMFFKFWLIFYALIHLLFHFLSLSLSLSLCFYLSALFFFYLFPPSSRSPFVNVGTCNLYLFLPFLLFSQDSNEKIPVICFDCGFVIEIALSARTSSFLWVSPSRQCLCCISIPIFSTNCFSCFKSMQNYFLFSKKIALAIMQTFKVVSNGCT